MVVCVNCGASFEKTMPKCPYCGHIYEAGAQQEYMDQLQELQEDLSEVTEESRRLSRGQRNAVLKKVLWITGGAVLVTGVLALLMAVLFHWADSGWEEDVKAELVWQSANYPKLDAWYEEGDYDAILSFYDTLLETEEEGYTAIYAWDHIMLVWDYEMYCIAIQIRDAIRAGEEISAYDAREAVSCAMEFVYFKDPVMYAETEREIIAGWQWEMREFLYGELGFDQAEADSLYHRINDDGLLDYEKCDAYTDEIAGRFQAGDT